ncbi:YheC/YheD family protein [Legionella fairfieldensis]|uniref:YheC/YheD family protein n=1 Tax=Legionella fairfieldensis TaxID=45064 RepID=UPI0006869F03|nr:hypothetical protein [Legionella fairfieldensis]
MSRQYYFCLDESQSPTYFNLKRYLQKRGWRSCYFNGQADFSEQNFQFHQKAAEHLEFKHLLSDLMACYCPQIMPLTYCINDKNWPLILEQLTHDFYKQNELRQNQLDPVVWILKPALLNNGQGIKIFQQPDELEQHFLCSQRLGGEHVLQRYITNPHLLREHHKYSIRMFVVITNYAGAYLYPQGYMNVALHPFTAHDFSDLRSHLTNEHLQDDTENVIQIPSQRFTFFASLYPQIKTRVTTVIKNLQYLYPEAFICNNHRTLAIFGFDFMVDNEGQLWFLEANHGPCFPISEEHPLQNYLYHKFWQAFVADFVIPIARRSNERGQFFDALIIQ